MFQWTTRRTLTNLSSSSPLRLMNKTSVPLLLSPFQHQHQRPSLITLLTDLTQKRWNTRGNTYQPSTLKRKRRVGFLARAKSKMGQKIIKRRKEKGRWYLSH